LLLPLLWFAAGVAGALAFILALRCRGRALPLAPFELVVGDTHSVESFAREAGTELANLASSIEGHAQHLCEAIECNDSRGENLGAAVRRLRYFSDKLLSFTRESARASRSIEVADLLRRVGCELRHEMQGRQIELRIAPALPNARADAGQLRNALLFLVDAVLGLEPDAAVLSLRASLDLDEEADSCILIELQAECAQTAPRTPQVGEATSLSYRAAQRVLAANDAELTLCYWPGHRANACVVLKVADTDEEIDAIAAEPMEAHRFGGALILIGDPSLRALLHQELDQRGRRVVQCTDSAAAQTLFHATPERFEFLILDADDRPEPVEALARTALETEPDVRVLVLRHRRSLQPLPSAALRPRYEELYKPFGIMELRETMARFERPLRAASAV
jgi:hypothetical protein